MESACNVSTIPKVTIAKIVNQVILEMQSIWVVLNAPVTRSEQQILYRTVALIKENIIVIESMEFVAAYQMSKEINVISKKY